MSRLYFIGLWLGLVRKVTRRLLGCEQVNIRLLVGCKVVSRLYLITESVLITGSIKLHAGYMANLWEATINSGLVKVKSG